MAVGDAGFVMNGMLSACANANRDFLLNCVAYLSGSGVYGTGGDDAGILAAGMDRETRTKFLIAASLAAPVLVFLSFLVFSSGRRRSE